MNIRLFTHIARAARTISAFCFLLSVLSASAASLSLTDIRVPITGIGEPVSTSMVKVARSLIILSNEVANGTGGGGAGFFIDTTNGLGTNLFVVHPLTLLETASTWIRWTNAPPITVPPTNIPPEWTNNVCTNMSGPYYPWGTNGLFTNACGYVIIVTTGGDPTQDEDGWETNNLPSFTNQVNSLTRYLKSVIVTDPSTGMSGTYVWTNGVFWLDGLPTNCTPQTLHFNNTSGDGWHFRKGNTFVNGTAGASLFSAFAGITIATNTYNTSNGFPRNYWPGFSVQLTGFSGVTNINDIYEFAYRSDTVIILTNRVGHKVTTAYNNTTSFVNWTNAGFTCTWDVDAYWHGYDIMEMRVDSSGGTAYATRVNTGLGPSPTNTTKTWSLFNGASGSPNAHIFNRTNQWTNAIVIGEPGPSGSPGGIEGTAPPRLTYRSGTNCTWLQTFPRYTALVDSLNRLFCQMDGTGCGHIYLTTNGTCYVYGAGSLMFTIPQANTSEWKPCP